MGVWADDGWTWLVVRVAQSVTHDFNSTEDGISGVLPQLRQLVGQGLNVHFEVFVVID